MAKTTPPGHLDLVRRANRAGRESGTHSMMFQQAVAHVLGLNASDMKCLDLIVLNQATTPSTLAKMTGLTTGAVTVLIDRLEKAGFVTREPHPDDRRKTCLVATKKVFKKVVPLYESMGKAMERQFSKYSKKELECLIDFFQATCEIWRNETERVLEGTRH